LRNHASVGWVYVGKLPRAAHELPIDVVQN
jgi:hypothetical protein